MTPRNVLIFHSGALGDFVLVWPLILGVARVMAQNRVIVVAGGDKGKLAQRVLRVESSDVEAGWHHLFNEAGAARLPEKPAKLLEGARLVLSFVAEFGSTWEKNLRQLAPDAQVHCLPPRPTRDIVSAIDFLLGALEDEPILHAATAGMVASIRNVGLMPRLCNAAGPIVIHPGSGSPGKNWPAERWLELLKLADRSTRVVLGEVETETMPAKVQSRFAQASPDVRRPTNLGELLDALTGTCGFVGHDSGPTQLAAMIGLPTLALFGPTDPAVWSPLGPRVATLHHAPLSDLEPEAVARTLTELILTQ